MALGVIYDLQQELPVVVVDLLRPQRTVVINRQQVPAVHLWEHGHTSAQSLKCVTFIGATENTCVCIEPHKVTVGFSLTNNSR